MGRGQKAKAELLSSDDDSEDGVQIIEGKPDQVVPVKQEPGKEALEAAQARHQEKLQRYRREISAEVIETLKAELRADMEKQYQNLAAIPNAFATKPEGEDENENPLR